MTDNGDEDKVYPAVCLCLRCARRRLPEGKKRVYEEVLERAAMITIRLRK